MRYLLHHIVHYIHVRQIDLFIYQFGKIQNVTCNRFQSQIAFNSLLGATLFNLAIISAVIVV